MTPTPKYIQRSEWPALLWSKYGIRYSVKSFIKFATSGGGPKYCVMGGRAYSTDEWLDDWVTSKAKPRFTTSDAA